MQEHAGSELQGVLILHWKKKAMLGNTTISLFIDNELVNRLRFDCDSQTMVPLLQGSHQILAPMGFHKAETRVEIIASYYTEIDLEYSRAAGNIKYANVRNSGPIDRNTMAQIINYANGRRIFMREISSYTNQGYQIATLTDMQAVIILNKITKGLMGAVPAVINAATDKVVIDLHPNGTVSNSLDKKVGSAARSSFCSKCGKAVLPGQSFCSFCGNKL